MVKVHTSVTIRRPLEDVFAFVSDVENLPRWAHVAQKARRTTNGPIGVGSRFAASINFHGRHVDAEYVVTEFEQNKRVSFKTYSGPMVLRNTYTFDRIDDATRVDVVSQGERSGVPKFLERLAAPVIEHQFRMDHENLKRVLEEQAARA